MSEENCFSGELVLKLEEELEKLLELEDKEEEDIFEFKIKLYVLNLDCKSYIWLSLL